MNFLYALRHNERRVKRGEFALRLTIILTSTAATIGCDQHNQIIRDVFCNSILTTIPNEDFSSGMATASHRLTRVTKPHRYILLSRIFSDGKNQVKTWLKLFKYDLLTQNKDEKEQWALYCNPIR
jgi:hypothetical protein